MKKVMAGGVFNIIHPGHIYFLKEAKRQGDFLIVVIASDRTAGKKALFPARIRKRLVESLDFVDKVIIGSSTDKMAVVQRERPDLIVLGYDQQMDIKGIPVKKLGKLEGFSTKEIIRKIKRSGADQ